MKKNVNLINMRVNKNVFLLGITSFFNDISSKIIEPILPMFLTLVGANPLIIGIIGGLRDSISSLLDLFSGYWSDRLKSRKFFVFLGYFSSSLFKFLIAIVKTPFLIFSFSSLERIGKGLRSAPRDAIIADSSKKQTGKNFGIHRFFDSGGAFTGALIVFLMLWYFNLNYVLIIIISALLGFVALIPLAFVKEPPIKNPKNLKPSLSFKNIPSNIKYFILVSSLFAFANINYMFFILKVQDFFVDDFYKKTIPILYYMLFNLVYALLAIPFGRFADKKSKHYVLIIGYFVFSGVMLLFANFSGLRIYVLMFFLLGVAYAMINSNERALISDLSKNFKATNFGIYYFFVSIIAFLSSFFAGIIYSFNSSFTFYYAFVFSFLAGLSLMLFKKKIVVHS
ncbi:MAG: MFS transporter [Candidatus Woesearchaeota archaeon]